MRNVKKVVKILILLLYGIQYAQAQSASTSELLIKYDLKTHKTDKVMPFDHPFTLIVDKLSTKKLDKIEVFETKFKNGERSDVMQRVDYAGLCSQRSVKDMTLNHNLSGDTLEIYFPALKPNVSFDVSVIYKLSEDCRKQLLKVNRNLEQAILYRNLDEDLFIEYLNNADEAYSAFQNCTRDKEANNQYMSVTFGEYVPFYLDNISVNFISSENADEYTATGSLTNDQIVAIGKSSPRKTDLKDTSILVEIVKFNLWGNIQNGTLDIKKAILHNTFDPQDFTLIERQNNLKNNLKYLENLLLQIDEIILRGGTTVFVNGGVQNIDTIRTAVLEIKDNVFQNLRRTSNFLKSIDYEIDRNVSMRQSIYLAGGTSLNNLKTESGNIIFLDAGLACLAVKSLDNSVELIPKLYWGISIYFRSIDKNTRKGGFYSKFDPAKNKGFDTANNSLGPDYGVATNWTILQHLCLNIGTTIGGMTNKEFDNFYSSSSLLVGPALRFERAFKVSAGLALVRRSAENPLISEKKVLAGCFVSLSADIDFIGVIKDVIGKL